MTPARARIGSGGERGEGGAGHLVGRALLLYLVFVIYGSLVPLEFRPMPIESAWQAFGQAGLLDVGAAGRADWIANGVLYLPLGFLATSLLLRRGGRPVTAVLGTMGLILTVSLSVEFVQLFFPPRTVSLNDLLAEFIGGGVGAGLGVATADRLRGLLGAWMSGAERLAPWLLRLYAIGYCAFSFFPFDFLISSVELAQKFASGSWGWLWADGQARGGAVARAAKLLAETLAALPLGWLVATQGWTVRRALAGGAALGVAIELGQFFLVSGVAQGLSVATRALGVGAGALACARRGRLDPVALAWKIRRFALPLMILYLLALVAVTGWFELPVRGWLEAGLMLEDVRFLPFYYHYYTTEQAALLSLTSVCLMYSPVGVLAWVAYLRPGLAGLIAAMLAALIETSKLFLEGLHPDPTNLLIAGVAAWLAGRLASGAEKLALATGYRGTRLSRQRVGDPGATSPALSVAAAPAVRDVPRPGGVALVGLAPAVAMLALGVAFFPLHPGLLALLLIAYAVALWWRPHYLWVAVPAALPMLDLAPWSGRFFIDEFDLLLLVSVAVGFARVTPTATGRRNGSLRLVTVLLMVTYGIGAARGLLPLQPPDVNSFSHYYSPYNSLRIVKGVAWALLLAGLASRSAASGLPVFRYFGTGMIVGLAGTVAIVIWERWTFPGLFNFTDVYRVTGPFSAMHVGGADLEAYLTAAVPFLVWRVLMQQGWPERALGLVLLVGSTYAVMVSFSRAGFAGYGLAILVTAVFALVRGAHRMDGGCVPAAMEAAPTSCTGSTEGRNQSRAHLVEKPETARSKQPALLRGLGAAALLAIVVAVAAPVLLGGFAQDRLARAGEDFGVRVAHWRDALAMRDPDLSTSLFGMGLGTFPVTHHWRSAEIRAAGFLIAEEGGDRFLRLGTGSPVFVEQFVAPRPNRQYELRLRARSADGPGELAVSLCEKWLLTSARCVFQTLQISSGDWQEYSITIHSEEVGSGPWYKKRPVKLSLYNTGQGATVDADDMQFMLPNGSNLLSNGHFVDGMDRWFFSADVDLPWHIWSQPVTVLFETGWLGLAVLGSLSLVALARGGRLAWAGEPAAACLLAVAVGWTCLGVVDSLGDSPRLLMLGLFVISYLFSINSAQMRLATRAKRG